MAITTMTTNPQVITVSGTTEHEINFKDMISPDEWSGNALIQLLTGTSVQFSSNGTLGETSGALNSTVDKLVLTVKRSGPNIKYKGGAGSETFIITIVD
jgi:hypothetical protein